MAGVRSEITVHSVKRSDSYPFLLCTAVMLIAGIFALSACTAVPSTAVPAPVTASTPTVVGSELVTSTPLVEPEGTQTTLPAAAVQTSLPSPTPVRTQMSLSDGMVMLYVPAGDFLMGSLDGEGEKDERPQHTVHLDDFWIDETEVTNRMYRECVDAGSLQGTRANKLVYP